MIKFRCYRCHRKYTKADAKIGRQFTCSCDSLLRVPKKDDGNCRVKTLADRLVEAVICGGGGAFLGFCFAIFLVSRMALRDPYLAFYLVPNLTIGFGLIGLLCGERSIDWIGNLIRHHERD